MAQEDVGLRFVVSGRGAAVGAFGSVRSSLVSVRGAAVATGAALYGVGSALRSSIDEARESERVGKVTEARLRSTGHAANVSRREIERLSGAISKKVGIDDEAIQSASSMLTMYRNVRNETGKGNQIFTRGTRALVDYAAAMGGGRANGQLNLTTAARTVGRALDDPLKGTTLLAKATGGFTDAQKQQIKTLMESGRTLEAQRILLDRLRVSTGGTAAANATMGDKVSVAWGNIQEQLGTSLLPTLDKVERAFLRQGVPAVQHYLEVFDRDGVPALRRFGRAVGPLAAEVVPALGSGLSTAADALAKAAPYAREIVGAFNSLPAGAQQVIFGSAAVAFAARKTRRMLGSASNGGLLGDLGSGGLGPNGSAASPFYVIGLNGAGGQLPAAAGAPASRSRGKRPGSPRRAPSQAAGAAAYTTGLLYSVFGRDLPKPVLKYLDPIVSGSVLGAPYGPTGMLLTAAAGAGVSLSRALRPYTQPKLTPLKTVENTRGVDIFSTLLTDPGRMGRSQSALAQLFSATKTFGGGADNARRAVSQLDASVAALSGQRLDTGQARAELAALRQEAADARAAVSSVSLAIGIASGGLFGGSNATSDLLTQGLGGRRHRSPRAPRIPVTATAGRASGAALSAPRGGDQMVIELTLDGEVLERKIVSRLTDKEARR